MENRKEQSVNNQFHPEWIDAEVFVAPGAVILGEVHIAAQSSVWYTAVLRGDTDVITIGPRTNVQDGAIIHVDAGIPCTIGSGVTIGHRAVVHGALIEDDVLIGIGAIVLSGARIGRECIIGAGSLVTGHSVIPPRSMVLGVPGRVVRSLTDEEVASIHAAAEHYVAHSAAYRTHV
jgi:carbonic anhydrase/acetyltransferase-like protein (isoleucine patch superfamily)